MGMNNNSLLKEYTDNGYCIIKNLRSIIYSKTNRVLSELTEIGKSINPNFDLTNPKSVGYANKENFYKAMKYALGLYDLAATKELVDICKDLNCKIPTLHDSYLRSDIIEEKQHAALWHQDGPNILGSPNTVCFWIPCNNVSKETGTIEIIEKSHRKGIYKNKSKPGENLLTTHELCIDESNLPKEKRILVDLKKGEFLVFSPLLVHRSHYPQKSNHTRITAIIRYDDASDKKHIEGGFVQGSDNKNINSAPQYK